MATLIDQPTGLVSGLRNVTYTFDMPSIGVAPEKKYFIYMLKVDGVNAYSQYKIYNPKSNGQDIVIDFADDLRGLLQTTAPPYNLPVAAVAATKIIRQITVEYGEKTIDTTTCEDGVITIDGETDAVSVLNGINRVYELEPDSDFQILSKRPDRYAINLNTKDFLYVTGVCTVRVSYYNDFFISSIDYPVNESHAGGLVIIIPIGFQGAPAGTTSIRVTMPELVSGENPTGLYCRIDSESCQDDDGSPFDLYLQNHWGGVDTLTFDNVDNQQMSVVKQEIVNRYDSSDSTVLQTGQRRSVNNLSGSSFTLKKTFLHIDFKTSRWLNELVATNNAWCMMQHESGTNLLIRVVIVDATIPTYGDDAELILTVKYSEVELYPN